MDCFQCKLCFYNDVDPFSTAATVAEPTIKPSFLFSKDLLIKEIVRDIHKILSPPHSLENSVLQLCKFKENQVEYGPFLDCDLSLHEQYEDLDSVLEKGNVCVVLRTKLSVRVEALIEKIKNTDGKELRRVLFALKQVFQDDKDLVQEFLARRGLHCLRQIGSKNDQNHQNYILRALGQLMLYVDGMNGVLADPETIEWLYSLLNSKFRLVVKLALKLLVVFMEYAKSPELHASEIISAIEEYHRKTGGQPWSLTIKIMAEEESNDSELVTYTITFINKVLGALPDQDTFYDVTDWLEEQGIEKISKEVRKKANVDVDMVKQFKIYETALKMEDGVEHLNMEYDGGRNLPRAKSETNLNGTRKSKRIQSIENHDNEPSSPKILNIIIDDQRKRTDKTKEVKKPTSTDLDDGDSDIDEVPPFIYNVRRASVKKDVDEDSNNDIDNHNASIKRHKFFIKPKHQELYKSLECLNYSKVVENKVDELISSPSLSRPQSLSLEEDNNSVFLENVLQSVKENLLASSNEINGGCCTTILPVIKIVTDSGESSPKVLSLCQKSVGQSQTREDATFRGNAESSGDRAKQSVKTIKNQFASKTKIIEEVPKYVPPGDLTGVISTAKDLLQNTIDKPPISSKVLPIELMKDQKVNHSNDTPDWDQLELECASKSLKIKDWDFSDLKASEDHNDSDSRIVSPTSNAPPPPPPPPPSFYVKVPLAPGPPVPDPPKSLITPVSVGENMTKIPSAGKPKQKRTTKLHWRSINSSYYDMNSSIWSKVKIVNFETEKIEALFENKPHDTKKEVKHEVGPKKIEVLDIKRSTAINIGMTNLPPIPSIKSAILNMHTNIINREGVEKLLATMLPTQEEVDSIKAALVINNDAPLGQAETFLLELNEINLLQPRLEVWLFLLDFDQIQRDIMESLMDLMIGIKEIYESKTLVHVLSTILTLGNFLNGSQVSSFSLDYLQKVPEVKDTKHKHSLLYHVVMIVRKEFPNSTDLHSDLGALNRCHRLDWDEIAKKIQKLKNDCKRSWDHLRLIFKSDQTNVDVTTKLKTFYWEASESIVGMEIIHRRVMNRFLKVLEYVGFPWREAQEIKVRDFCRIMSDFAIEYRTTREKIEQFEEKKVKDKEKMKTRGAMIADINVNSLERGNKIVGMKDNIDLMNVIMSRTSLGNSDCENDINSLNNCRLRRNTQNNIPLDGINVRPRPLSLYHIRNPDSSSSMTPAVSDIALDQSDKVLDKLAQNATSSSNKRKTRRSSGKERKSMRRTKPNIHEDIIRNLQETERSTV